MQLVLLASAIVFGIAADICTDDEAALKVIAGKFPPRIRPDLKLYETLYNYKAEMNDSLPDNLAVFGGIKARCELIDQCTLKKEEVAELKKQVELDSLEAFVKKAHEFYYEAEFPFIFGDKYDYLEDLKDCFDSRKLVASVERGERNFEAAKGTDDFAPQTFVTALLKTSGLSTTPVKGAARAKLILKAFDIISKEFEETHDISKAYQFCTFMASASATSEQFEQLKAIRRTGTLDQFKGMMESNCARKTPVSCSGVPLCSGLLYWKP